MYRFSVSTGQRVGFDLDRTGGSNLDSVLRLFHGSGVELAASDDDPGPEPEGSGLEAYIEYTFNTAGTYYLGVSAYPNLHYNPITGGGDREGTALGGYVVFFDNIPQHAPPTDIVLDNDSHAFTLVSGEGDADNDAFLLGGDQLFIKQGVELDHEAKSSFAFRVRVADQTGASLEKPLVVQVTDLGEIESITIGDGTSSRSRVEQVQVAFDGLMSINAGAFELLKRGAAGGVVGLNVSSAEVDGQTVATLTFSGGFVEHGFLVDGNYALRIFGEEMLDANGNGLDANRDGEFGGSHHFGDTEADNFFRYFGE